MKRRPPGDAQTRIGLLPLVILLMITSLSIAACGSLGYYSEAVNGHLSLMARRQSIDTLIRKDTTPEWLRKRLTLIREIRDFASAELGLPDNGSYRSYVEVEGEALVWSLVATGAFSVEPLQWCYPVIGCASYRGYFDRVSALRRQAFLEGEGFDVALEPVPAYSSLGWFDDPVPGTVIDWVNWQLAGLIFHELAHQRLYLPGDSAFNEAFANLVQQIGVERWLLAAGDLAAIRDWHSSQERERAFIGLLMETRKRLQELYVQPLSDEQKLRCKQALLSALEEDYELLKQGWNGYPGYDRWFDTPVNNARFASIATYEHWIPAFKQLYYLANGEMQAFYTASETVSKLPSEQRARHLASLSAKARPMRGSVAGSIPMHVSRANGC